MNNHLRFGLAFPQIHLAAPTANLPIIKNMVQEAKKEKVDFLLFPPLSFTGDGLGKLNRHPGILAGCKEGLRQLSLYEKEIPLLVGLPFLWEKRLFSVMALLHQGEIQGYIPLSSKELIFSDPLLFPKELLPPQEFYAISLHLDDDFSYPGKEKEIALRLDQCQGKEQNKKPQLYLSCPQSYSTSGGIHASQYLLLDQGEILDQGKWIQGLKVLSLPLKKGMFDLLSYEKPEQPENSSPLPFLSNSHALYQDLLLHQAKAYAKRLKRTGLSHSILGISGGLDSTWALIATLHAHEEAGLSLETIHPIILPGFGSSQDTMKSALDLLHALELTPEIISIEKAVLGHFDDIGHDKNSLSIVYENAQARERTQILMDLANGYGGLVVGTGDMSEIALGWSTYNGDQMSMYGLNAGIPKTLIQDLILWYAKKSGGELEKALLHILGRPISPELLPPDKQGEILQKTEELLGKYELMDFILYHSLKDSSIKDIDQKMQSAFPTLAKAQRKDYLTRFYQRFVSQQFKRTASPDGIQLTQPNLVGYTMASDLSSLDFVKEIEEL